MKPILAALAAVLIAGCAQIYELIPEPKQQLKTGTTYKRDMIVEVNGVAAEGVMVAELHTSNQIHVVARGDLDMFSMKSCHREWTKEKAWNITEEVSSGLFGWGRRKIDKTREVEFTYTPVKGIEDLGACPLELGGYSKDGQHSWAIVDFKTPLEELPITVLCNGSKTKAKGVAICQARTGLMERVEFESDVIISPDTGCELGVTEGKVFEFLQPRGVCVYRIQELTGAKRVGRLTLVGYEGILIRE